MTRPRLRRTLIFTTIAAAAGTAGVALAIAQTAATPTGNFGGGALAVPVSEKTIAKDMLLSIRATAGGKVGIDGHLYAGCGLGTISGVTKAAADGSFTLRGDVTRKPLSGVRQTTTFVVKGTLTAEGGSGTASMKLRVRTKGRATRNCSSRTVSWTVRRPIVTGAPAGPAPADGTFYGLTSQSGARGKRAIVLHATKGGTAIDRLAFGFRSSSCEHKRIIVNDDVNITPEFDVKADGSFRKVEKFKVTFADVILRTTVVVRGQFDQAGGVAGKLAVTERYVNRRSGKRVDICKTGTRTWSARS